MLHIIFVLVAVKTLGGVATCGEGEGRAGSSYELDAAQSIPYPIFWTFWAASYGRHKSLPNSIFCYLNEKIHIQ
jgi:hypothetical protein